MVRQKKIDLDIQKIGGQWQCKELIFHLFTTSAGLFETNK